MLLWLFGLACRIAGPVQGARKWNHESRNPLVPERSQGFLFLLSCFPDSINSSFVVFGLAVLEEAIDGNADDLSEFSVLLEGQFLHSGDLILREANGFI